MGWQIWCESGGELTIEFSNCSKTAPLCSLTTAVITHCTNKLVQSDSPLHCDFLNKAQISKVVPPGKPQQSAFSSKWASNFSLHGDRRRGPLPHLQPSHSFLNFNSCRSVLLLYGSTPCGNDAQVWRNLSLLWLSSHQRWRWMSPHTTSHLSVTPDDCLWSMKATLSRLLFASVASEEKKKLKKALIPKKWNRQKFLPLHLTCACLICRKKYPILPEHNVARGQSFDISRGDLIHVLLQQRKRHFTGPPPLCTEKWKR